MTDRWLTITEAAGRVDKSEATIYRWSRSELLTILVGRVSEAQLLEADRIMRGRIGRPRKLRKPQ